MRDLAAVRVKDRTCAHSDGGLVTPGIGELNQIANNDEAGSTRTNLDRIEGRLRVRRSRHSIDPSASASKVSDMFPATISPSRAGDFLTCPLLYRLRVIDKLPEPPSAAAVRGTLVHGALEDLFALEARDRTVDRAVELFEQRWLTLRDSDPDSAAALVEGLSSALDLTALAQAVIAPSRALLDTYFAMEDPRRLEPHAREMAVSTELDDGLTLRGFVDRVDRAPDGRIRLVDYKTGKSPGAGYESKAMFQMRFYALVWWRMTGEVPTRLQLMYFKDGQTINYEPIADELIATERKVLAIRDAITRAVDDGFRPSPSALCAWCSFHDYCPSQGGTTPPLPAVD